VSVLAVFLAATVLAGLTPGQNAVTVTAPYSTRPIAVGDLDGNPATGDWTDAAAVTVALENGRTDAYGSASLSVKHDGTYLYVKVSGKIDVPWTSATGTHFWTGFIFSPPSTTGHHRDGMDGVFFGQSSYTPAPTYPLAPVDTNGGSRPPAKDTVQNAEGTLRYSGTAAPYDYTGEWRRPLNSGDSQDLVLAADGTTAYPFYVTTDSNGRGSLGGAIDHSVLTHENALFFARVPVPETHDVAVTAASASPLSLVAGGIVTIAVTVQNQGTAAESFAVSATAGSLAVGATSVSGLAAGASRDLSFAWDTTGFAADAYPVRVEAAAVPGETDLSDNARAAGTVAVESPPPAPALLRVSTSIDLHPTWGVPGKVLVNAVARDEWSLTWVKMPAGTYTVSFSDVWNLGTPAPITVNLVSGQATEVPGVYQAYGWLRVVTNPPVPGTISVDGAQADDWEVWRAIPPGDHTVAFGPVASFRPPAARTVRVNAEQLTTVQGDYTADPAAPGPDPATYGMLRVTTALSTDPGAGAPSAISVNGIVRDEWALTWVKVPPGTYTVSFGDVVNLGTPADQVVEVAAGQAREVVGVFQVHGFLRVDTSPPVPGTIFVNGLPYDDWQVWQSMPAGSYEVSFGPVAGYATPAVRTVTVSPGALTTTTGTYASLSPGRGDA